MFRESKKRKGRRPTTASDGSISKEDFRFLRENKLRKRVGDAWFHFPPLRFIVSEVSRVDTYKANALIVKYKVRKRQSWRHRGGRKLKERRRQKDIRFKPIWRVKIKCCDWKNIFSDVDSLEFQNILLLVLWLDRKSDQIQLLRLLQNFSLIKLSDQIQFLRLLQNFH